MKNLKEVIIEKVNILIVNDNYIDAAKLIKQIPKIISFVEKVFVDGRCTNNRAKLMRQTGRGDNYISHIIGAMYNYGLIKLSGDEKSSQYVMTLKTSERE